MLGASDPDKAQFKKHHTVLQGFFLFPFMSQTSFLLCEICKMGQVNNRVSGARGHVKTKHKTNNLLTVKQMRATADE